MKKGRRRPGNQMADSIHTAAIPPLFLAFSPSHPDRFLSSPEHPFLLLSSGGGEGEGGRKVIVADGEKGRKGSVGRQQRSAKGGKKKTCLSRHRKDCKKGREARKGSVSHAGGQTVSPFFVDFLGERRRRRKEIWAGGKRTRNQFSLLFIPPLLLFGASSSSSLFPARPRRGRT